VRRLKACSSIFHFPVKVFIGSEYILTAYYTSIT